VTQFPPWSSHSPVCTITAVSKDLVRRRLVFHMILVSPPYRRLGCLLADSGTIRREVTRPVADALVCSYYVRCVSTPEIFGGRFGNHSRTGAVKLLINAGRASRLSSSGYRSPDYSLSRGRNWLRSSPRSKRMIDLAPRVLCSRAVSVGNAGSRCGNPGRRAEPTWPARPFRRSQLCTLCWPALLRRPLRCALDSAPT